MRLKRDNNKIVIEDIIRTIEDGEKIINALNSIKDNTIEIEIYDSYVIPSTLIGNLLRLKEEGKEIRMSVRNDLLYEVLKDLNLDIPFNLRKI